MSAAPSTALRSAKLRRSAPATFALARLLSVVDLASAHAVVMSGLCSRVSPRLLGSSPGDLESGVVYARVRRGVMWPEGWISLPWEAAWLVSSGAAMWQLRGMACLSISAADAATVWDGQQQQGVSSTLRCVFVGEGLAWVGLPCLAGMAVVALHAGRRLLQCGVCA